MPFQEPYIQDDEVPPLLKATLHMDDSFTGLRRDLLQPYPDPSDSHVHYTIWHEAELATRERAENAIAYWVVYRVLPDLDDDVAYFLCRRFDQASEFIRSLYIGGQDTIFMHDGLETNEALQWMLCSWWEEHGIVKAYFEDLESFEKTDEDNDNLARN